MKKRRLWQNAAKKKIFQKDLDAKNLMQIKLALKRPTDKNDVLEFPFQKSRFQFLRKRFENVWKIT